MGGWGTRGPDTLWALGVPGSPLLAWAQGGEGKGQAALGSSGEAGSESRPGVRGRETTPHPSLGWGANFQLRFPEGSRLRTVGGWAAGAWIREAGCAHGACKCGWGFLCVFLPCGNVRIVYSH